MKLFSNTVNVLEQGLSFSSLKGKAIAQNIANADTPNYKAQNISFKSYLNQNLNQGQEAYRTDKRHFAFSPRAVNVNPSVRSQGNYNSTGNSVDMDKEMSDLASNQIYYNALIERLNGNFRTLESVIKGGK